MQTAIMLEYFEIRRTNKRKERVEAGLHKIFLEKFFQKLADMKNMTR